MASRRASGMMERMSLSWNCRPSRRISLHLLCALIWGSALSAPLPAQDAYGPGEEAPAYNDLVARSFLIEVQPLVEKHTGWSLGGFPKFRLVTQAEYTKVASQELVAQLRKARPDEPEEKLAAVAREIVGDRAVGLIGKYSPLTKVIYLLPGNLKPMLREMKVEERYTRDLIEVIIAHEMTHALQDAKYPIAEAIGSLRNGAQLEIYGTLLEGHACFIQERVARDLRLDEAATRLAAQMAVQNEVMPPVNGRGIWARYVEGKRFVEVAFQTGGMPRVQQLFTQLPTDMSALQRPEAFFEHHHPPSPANAREALLVNASSSAHAWPAGRPAHRCTVAMSIVPDGRAARAADLGQGEIRKGDDCEDDFHDSIGSQTAEVPRVLSSRINSFPGSSATPLASFQNIFECAQPLSRLRRRTSLCSRRDRLLHQTGSHLRCRLQRGEDDRECARSHSARAAVAELRGADHRRLVEGRDLRDRPEAREPKR
jgi:hypothetical protein